MHYMIIFMKDTVTIDRRRKFILCSLFFSLLFFCTSRYTAAQYHKNQADRAADPVSEISIEIPNSTIEINSAATLSLLLQPGNYPNAEVDLWLLGVKGTLLYYFDTASMQFIPGLHPTYQGSMIELNRLNLPVIFREAGEYAIYFGVDTVANGELDFATGELFYSMASLTVNLSGQNMITYLYNDELYRIAALPGADPENISDTLDAISSGADDSINVSPNGEWYLISSQRFHADCDGWACLTISNSDFSHNEVIISNGSVIHGEGPSAVNSAGNSIVYSYENEVHIRDLWSVTRKAGQWSAPLLLTEASPFQYNTVPAISNEGDRVIFECGNEPYLNKSICEVKLDGTGFRVVFTPDSHYMAARTPDYAPDGTIVAEIDVTEQGESIYKIVPDTGQITPVNLEFTNDNSPCLLSNGNIVSLWLDREGGNGVHELKVMDNSGSGYFMLLTDIDIEDVILGCASW